jgi:hypothetical protein
VKKLEFPIVECPVIQDELLKKLEKSTFDIEAVEDNTNNPAE